MKVCLIPVPEGQWFAFVGPEDNPGWASPNHALEFLNTGDFQAAGAAVGENAALAICLAALNAAEKRKKLSGEITTAPEIVFEDANPTLN